MTVKKYTELKKKNNNRPCTRHEKAITDAWVEVNHRPSEMKTFEIFINNTYIGKIKQNNRKKALEKAACQYPTGCRKEDISIFYEEDGFETSYRVSYKEGNSFPMYTINGNEFSLEDLKLLKELITEMIEEQEPL